MASVLDALHTARALLDDPPHRSEAIAAIRRLAKSLTGPDPLDNNYGISAAVMSLDAAAEDAIEEPLARLIMNLQALDELDAPAKSGILIIEDDEALQSLLASRLAGARRNILQAGSMREAEAILAAEDVSLIILDLILPDADGRSLVARLRADVHSAGIPIIVVSANLGPQPRTECFALGVDAYFEKPLDAASISAAAGAILERSAQARGESRTDPVTGLPNRAAFHESFAQRQSQASGAGPMSLAMLELDHFGWVQESFGQQMAENVLRRIGVRIAMGFPPETCFARWEGPEFMALLPGVSAEAAGVLLTKALQTVRRVKFTSSGQEFVTTFSAGVSEVPVGATIQDAIAKADRLLCLAKSSGHNRVLAGGEQTVAPARRVLFAEDDDAVVRLVTLQLQQEGFEVLHYPNGALALKAAAESGAALVISDVEMPEMDGLSFLRELRRLPACRHVPVMMLTAMGDEQYIVQAFELGADEYVVKPFSMNELVARIRRLLRRQSISGQLSAAAP